MGLSRAHASYRRGGQGRGSHVITTVNGQGSHMGVAGMTARQSCGRGSHVSMTVMGVAATRRCQRARHSHEHGSHVARQSHGIIVTIATLMGAAVTRAWQSPGVPSSTVASWHVLRIRWGARAASRQVLAASPQCLPQRLLHRHASRLRQHPCPAPC